MKDLIFYLFKSGLWITIFLAIYWFFFRKETFFRFNRIFLLSGLILSFLIPLYQFRYEIKIMVPVYMESSKTNSIITNTISIDWFLIILIIYLLGLLILTGLQIIGLKKIRGFIINNKTVLKGKYKLVDSPIFQTPFSIFNYIFINTQPISKMEKNLILDHEQSHIDQYHWIDLGLAKIVCIIQWFNPFVWLYIHYIRENHEYLADEAVIRKGYSPAVYQAILLNYSLNTRIYSFANTFAYSNLKRFNMMKTKISNPVKKWAILLLLPVSAVFFLAFAKQECTFLNIDRPLEGQIKKVQVIDQNDSVVIRSNILSDKKGIKKITITDEKINTNDSIKTSIEKPLIILDGKEIISIDNINPDNIKKIDVLKNKSATELYGEKGKNGVIVITSKIKVENKTDPLYIVDGKEVTSIKEINPEQISQIEVLKDKSAMYGEKGKNGVVIITTKKYQQIKGTGK